MPITFGSRPRRGTSPSPFAAREGSAARPRCLPASRPWPRASCVPWETSGRRAAVGRQTRAVRSRGGRGAPYRPRASVSRAAGASTRVPCAARLRSGKATVLATARLNARSAGRRVGMGQHGDGGAAAMAPAAITLWRSAGVPVERGCDATRSPRAEANRVRSRAGTGWRGPTQAHGREAPWRGGAAARAMDVAGTRGARAAVLGLPVCGRYRASDRSSRAATQQRRPRQSTAPP